jgi:hypothetical protein
MAAPVNSSQSFTGTITNSSNVEQQANGHDNKVLKTSDFNGPWGVEEGIPIIELTGAGSHERK